MRTSATLSLKRVHRRLASASSSSAKLDKSPKISILAPSDPSQAPINSASIKIILVDAQTTCCVKCLLVNATTQPSSLSIPCFSAAHVVNASYECRSMWVRESPAPRVSSQACSIMTRCHRCRHCCVHHLRCLDSAR